MLDAKNDSLRQAAEEVVRLNCQGQQLHDATYEKLTYWINTQSAVLNGTDQNEHRN